MGEQWIPGDFFERLETRLTSFLSGLQQNSLIVPVAKVYVGLK